MYVILSKIKYSEENKFVNILICTYETFTWYNNFRNINCTIIYFSSYLSYTELLFYNIFIWIKNLVKTTCTSIEKDFEIYIAKRFNNCLNSIIVEIEIFFWHLIGGIFTIPTFVLIALRTFSYKLHVCIYYLSIFCTLLLFWQISVIGSRGELWWAGK